MLGLIAMAEAAEQGRRLRGREVPVPPPPTVGPVAGSMNNLGACLGENARRIKAAAKRSAIDENYRVAITAPVQQAKKRAALANLTNCNAPITRNSATTSKAQVAANIASIKGKTRATREAQAQHLTGPLVAQKKAGISITNENQTKGTASKSTLPLHNVENIVLEGKETVLQVKEEKAEVAVPEVFETESHSQNEAIASLERKTQHTLYISKDTKTPVRQGSLFEESRVDGQASSSKNYTDIDSNHKDPQMCSSYATDIYHHLRMAELKRKPRTDFMEIIQQDINASMRGILVDWLVEVAEEYKLVPDTLYLTVSYIDRFLSGNVVNRQRLQLLGVSCMLIAAKYEEICAPQVEEFCYITDNTYCREELLEMERRVLKHLHFELTGPTTKSFLRRFIRAAQSNMKTPILQLEFLGNYLAELTLVEYDLLKYLPSVIAASAVFMAKVTLDPTVRPWNTTLQHYTGYRPSELKECAKAVHDLQCNTNNCTLPAIREKYRQHKFKCVASLAPPAVIQSEFFKDLDE